MSETPAGWTDAPIAAIASKVGSGATPKGGRDTYFDKGTPLIRSMNVHFDGFRYDGLAFLNQEQAKALAGVEVFANDVLLNITGASIGRVTMAPAELAGARVNQHVSIIRPVQGIEPMFLARYLASPALQGFITDEQTGTTRQALTKEQILGIEIPLAPLPEQRRIVAKLDALQLRTRIAREALETVTPLLKGFRQSVLQAAVSGALTEEWRSTQQKTEPWKDVALQEVAMDFSYGTATKSSQIGEIPVLRMGNLQFGKLEWDRLVYTSDKSEIKKYGLSSGDLLFNRTNSPELVGKTAVYRGERPAIYAGYLIKVRCGTSLLPDFLNYSLTSPSGREWCWEVKTDGVSQSNISAGKLAQYRMSLPPLAEQAEIVRRVEKLFSMADAMEAEFVAAQRSVDQLDQSLLATAFRGELVPQDPSDEPASVLLERIRAAREAVPEVKGKRGRKTSRESDPGLLIAAEPSMVKKRGRPRKG